MWLLKVISNSIMIYVLDLQSSTYEHKHDLDSFYLVDRASAPETVGLSSIPSRAKPKDFKTGIHSFPAWRSALKRTVWSLHRLRWAGGQVAAWLEDQKVPWLFVAKLVCSKYIYLSILFCSCREKTKRGWKTKPFVYQFIDVYLKQ